MASTAPFICIEISPPSISTLCVDGRELFLAAQPSMISNRRNRRMPAQSAGVQACTRLCGHVRLPLLEHVEVPLDRINFDFAGWDALVRFKSAASPVRHGWFEWLALIVDAFQHRPFEQFLLPLTRIANELRSRVALAVLSVTTGTIFLVQGSPIWRGGHDLG